MRMCFCGKGVFGTDKNTGVGYCSGHQYMRTDLSKKSIVQKAMDKKKVVSKISRLFVRQDETKFKEADEAVQKEKWFRLIRSKLIGTCQCGCGNKSQKKDDMYFRHSCCHIFPKSKFESIKYHPLNYVERAFFGGCHGVMDDTSMDKWVNVADWEDIKAKFHELAPLLTDEERATKFYSHLEKLVYSN